MMENGETLWNNSSGVNPEMELLADAALQQPQQQQLLHPCQLMGEEAETPSLHNFITPKHRRKNVRKMKNVLPNEAEMGVDNDESGSYSEREAFMKELENFHRERSLEFKPPKFYGRPLNWLKLWRTVIRLGGHEVLTASMLWRQVGESFHPPKTCTSVSWMFRTFYEKVLLEYEKHKREVGELQLPVGPFHQSSHVKKEIGSPTKKITVTKVKPMESLSDDEEEEAGQNKRKRKVTSSNQSLVKQPTSKSRKIHASKTRAPKSMKTACAKAPSWTTPNYTTGLQEVSVQYEEKTAMELQESFQHLNKALVVHNNPLGLELMSTNGGAEKDVKTQIPHDSNDLPSPVHQSKPMFDDIEDVVADFLIEASGDIPADLPDECELLAEMERVLSESFHCYPPKTTSVHSASDGPSLPAITLLLNIRDLLDTAVDALAEDGEVKQHLLDNLNQLAQLESHLPTYLLTIASKARLFFKDFLTNFPPAQETLANHQKLVVSRNRLHNELETAKEKRASFSHTASSIKDKLSEMDKEQAALEAQLKALMDRKAELQDMLKSSDSATYELKKNIVVWLKESREVVDNLKASEAAAKEARVVKESFKQKLVELKQSFHIIKP